MLERLSGSITNETESGTVLTDLGVTVRSGTQTTDRLSQSAENESRSYSVSFTGGSETESRWSSVSVDNHLDRTENYWIAPGVHDRDGTVEQSDSTSEATGLNRLRTWTVGDSTYSNGYSETSASLSAYQDDRTFDWTDGQKTETGTFARDKTGSVSTSQVYESNTSSSYTEEVSSSPPRTNSVSLTRTGTHRTVTESSSSYHETGEIDNSAESRTTSGTIDEERSRSHEYSYTDVEKTHSYLWETSHDNTRIITYSETSTQQQTSSNSWEYNDDGAYVTTDGVTSRTGQVHETTTTVEDVSDVDNYRRLDPGANSETPGTSTHTIQTTNSVSYTREESSEVDYADGAEGGAQASGGTTSLKVTQTSRSTVDDDLNGWGYAWAPFSPILPFSISSSTWDDIVREPPRRASNRAVRAHDPATAIQVEVRR